MASLHCAGRTRGKVSFPEQRDPRRCHAVVVTAAANPGARRSLRSLLSTPPGECLKVGSPGHRGVPYVPPGGSPSYGLGSARFPTSSPAPVIFHFFFNCYFLNGSHAEVCGGAPRGASPEGHELVHLPWRSVSSILCAVLNCLSLSPLSRGSPWCPGCCPWMRSFSFGPSFSGSCSFFLCFEQCELCCLLHLGF